MRIIKSTGQHQTFEKKKFIQSLVKSKVPRPVANQIFRQIESKLHDRITTQQIYKLAKQALLDANQTIGYHLYQLREAIATLDSIAFEKYIAQILTQWGFVSQWNVIVAGRCIEHQVDIVAYKEDKNYLVECKHHRKYHRDSGLGRILELDARWQDINEFKGQINYPLGRRAETIKFYKSWLITNTKFSEHAKNYAKCRRIELTGWKYGTRLTLERMVQEIHVYPLTMFGLNSRQSAELVEIDLVTTNDLLAYDSPPEKALAVLPAEKWYQIKQLHRLIAK